MRKGFTLIELLVVIAVLGVLAAGVFTAINPLERLAQARDSQRKVAFSQIIGAINTYYVSHNGTYPPNVNVSGSGAWIQTLVDTGDIKNVPPAVTYGSGTNSCGDPVAGRSAWTMQNNYCYVVYPDGKATAYVSLESAQAKSKCSGSTPYPYFAWSSEDSRVCLTCTPAGDAGFNGCVN